MTGEQHLRLFFEGLPKKVLTEHLQHLKDNEDGASKYRCGDGEITAPAFLARPLAEAELQHRRFMQENRRASITELRDAAACVPESLFPNGAVNLSSWLESKGGGWYTVFSYSSPDPREPWFCSLDPEAQCFVLLLVAEILETGA